MMRLIDNHSLWMAVEKCLGVSLNISQRVYILQTDVRQVGNSSRHSVVLPDWRGPVSVMTGKTLNAPENADANVLFINYLLILWPNL